MKKVIIGTKGCMNCARLSAMNPDVEKIELEPDALLPFARAVGIQSVPFVICVGSVEELDGVLK